MTRFVLIGGMQHKADPQALGAAVFDRPGLLRVLICLFARNPNLCGWQALYEETQAFFRALGQRFDLSFALADEENFENQVAAADIIFFSGGDGVALYGALARVGHAWTKQLDGKTVIGTSAGADMLSAYHFDPQQGALERGLGLAKVKVIVHFGAPEPHAPAIGWENALAALHGYGEELPVYPLREGEFVVLVQN